MPALVVDVEPAAFDAASRVFGLDVAVPLANAADALARALSGCAGMAGSDDAGRRWASSYDEAATATVGALQDVVNASYRLAALLEQTGLNHGMAEDASVPGGLRATAPDRTRWAGYVQTVPDPPSAGGGAPTGLPSGWWLIEHVVGYVWPNGHQDSLRAAAAAWSAVADALDVAAWGVPEALQAMAGQVSPEVPEALTACEGMQRHFRDLAAVCSSLAAACRDYAGHIDECHSAVEHELTSLVEWTVGIQVGGAALSFVTAGLSEGAAQVAEAGRIASTAAKVGALIERLVAAAGVAAETAAAAVPRAGEIRAGLQTLLRSRLIVAAVDGVPAMKVAMVASQGGRVLPAAANAARRTSDIESALAAIEHRLVSLRPSQRWGSERKLTRHVRDHAKDFAAQSGDEYTEMATGFFRRGVRERLPMKIDENGTVRIYDPGSNAFGSYGSDGTIYTYFKPTSPTYWERQPGRELWR